MSNADNPTAHPITPSTLVSAATVSALQPVVYPTNAILFQEHDADDRLYVILSGQIVLVSGYGTDAEHQVSVFGPGELLGAMSFFRPDHKQRFSARIRDTAEVLVLDRGRLDDVLRHEPLLAYELLGAASSIMHRTHERSMRALEEKNAQLSEAYLALEHAQVWLVQQERIEHELQLAREIQEGMLPASMPDVAGIDLGVRSIPAYEVGGDFYDVFALDSETLGVVIGDVVGKGMPAALYMAQTRSLIRAEARLSTSPEMVLRRVNTALQELNRSGMFVTVLFGRLEHASRRLVTARAGHEYPLVWASDGSELRGARGVGQPLGLLPDPALDVQARTLIAGDTLLLYTDGVTDVVNPAGDFFGLDGLHAAVQSAGSITAQDVCDHVVQQVAAFQATAVQPDDITMVVVQAY